MTNYIKYCLFFLFLLSSNMGNAQEIPILGEWDAEDYKINFNVQCNCNAAQKAAIEKSLRRSMENRIDYNLLDTYLEFNEGNKVEGILAEQELTGIYEQKINDIIIYLDDYQLDLDLITLPEEREISLSLGKDFLDAMKGSFDMDKIGKVDFQLTELTIIFKNIFDDAYEEYLDAKWEKETLEN